jgi:hypothetical protein
MRDREEGEKREGQEEQEAREERGGEKAPTPGEDVAEAAQEAVLGDGRHDGRLLRDLGLGAGAYNHPHFGST